MYPTSLFPVTITHETLELRDVVQSGVNIWDFEYPSYYKGDQKNAFEKKVLDHFWTRQIGQETVGRFLHYFRRTVREIMPLYIQRYESVDLIKDPEIRPLENYNMVEEYSSERSETGSESGTRTGSESSDTTGTVTSTTSETGKVTGATGGATVRSDTPQSTLNLPIGTGGSVTLSHASEAEETRGASSEDRTANGTNSSDSSGTSTTETSDSTTAESSTSGTEKHKLTRRGNIGVTTYAQLLDGYRQTFLNIDMEVINELEVCFLGVF